MIDCDEALPAPSTAAVAAAAASATVVDTGQAHLADGEEESVRDHDRDSIPVSHYGLRFDDERFRTIMQQRPNALRSLLIHGIPNNSMRREIWIRLMEAQDLDQRFPGLYDKLANNPSTLYESGIRKDVHRTFPQFELFEKDNCGQQMLFNVLKAISFFDTTVGYVQGMGFIVGFLLLQGMSEEECFWCLVQLFNHKRFGFKDVVREGLPKLRLLLYCVDRLLRLECPLLHTHLSQRIGAEPEMYASSFFLSLCCCRFPFGTLQRIFDIFLFDGWGFMLRIVVAVIKHCSDSIKDASLENIIPLIYECCTQIEAETLIQIALAIKLSDKDLTQWAKEYEGSLHPEEQQEIDKKRAKWSQWQRSQSLAPSETSDASGSSSPTKSMPNGGGPQQQSSTSIVRNLWAKITRNNSFNNASSFKQRNDSEPESQQNSSING